MSEHAIGNARAWLADILEIVARLDAARDEKAIGDADLIHDEIVEQPLSVMVRDGWRQPGAIHNDEGPEEYEILLSTGGPALRIYGRLDKYNQPDDEPQLQWQGWGTQWTSYPLGVEREAVATYAREFYFGD